MNRAEQRRIKKDQDKKSKTYTLTTEQIEKIKADATKLATEEAFFLMLAIPCEVLISEGYWEKTAKKRMPKFADDVCSLYNAFEGGVVDYKQLEDHLWEYAGYKIERANNE